MRTILIVEDDIDYRGMVERKLKTVGFSVISADNGEAALNIARNIPVDLVILDLIMPQMDGTTFYYHLRNTLKKDTPVLILTNSLQRTVPVDVDDFILKAEVSLDDVTKRVKKILHL